MKTINKIISQLTSLDDFKIENQTLKEEITTEKLILFDFQDYDKEDMEKEVSFDEFIQWCIDCVLEDASRVAHKYFDSVENLECLIAHLNNVKTICQKLESLIEGKNFQ